MDVAIYETHMGGEFDATNIVKTPVVTVISSIAMDHVRLLGPSIEDIAWHKAGIFKSDSLAISTLQEETVTAVLRQRAAEKGIALEFLGVDSTLPKNATALKPEAQRINCSLALAVARAWLTVKAPGAPNITKDLIAHGIERFSSPGRYHQINHLNHQWFLDGAHNESSLEHAVRWLAESAIENQQWVLQY